MLSPPQKKGRASDSLDPDRSTLQPVNAPTIKHPCVELVCKKTSLARSRHLQDFCKTCSLNLRVNRYDQRRAANRLKKFASPPSTVTDASHSPRSALLQITRSQHSLVDQGSLSLIPHTHHTLWLSLFSRSNASLLLVVSLLNQPLSLTAHTSPHPVPLPPSSPLLRQAFPATPLITPTHFTHSPLSNPPLTNHPTNHRPHTHLALASFPTLCRCALMPSLPVSFSLSSNTLTLSLSLSHPSQSHVSPPTKHTSSLWPIPLLGSPRSVSPTLSSHSLAHSPLSTNPAHLLSRSHFCARNPSLLRDWASGPLLLVFRLVSISSRPTHAHTCTASLSLPSAPAFVVSSLLSLAASACTPSHSQSVRPNPRQSAPSHTHSQLTNEPLNRPPFESANTPKFDCFCSMSACTSLVVVLVVISMSTSSVLCSRPEPISALKPSARVR